MRGVIVILMLIFLIVQQGVIVFDLILLQAFHTGEDICSTVPQDVAKAALCEFAVDNDFYSPIRLCD